MSLQDPASQEAGHGPSSPAYVLSCIVTAGSRPGELLLGVRRGTAVSPRHPGVLSTLTMRIPEALYRAVVDGDPSLYRVGSTTITTNSPVVAIGSDSSNSLPASYAIESLLARKLDLGHALSLGQLQASARLSAVAVQEVPDPQGGRPPEWTHMASFLLSITGGVNLIPSVTGAYSRLTWVQGSNLGLAFRSHDALLLDDSLDPFEVCISGLCIHSAVAVLEGAGLHS